MYHGSSIAVVVSAYNEEILIQDTLNGMPSYADRIYVVNDGSKDRTEEWIEELASKDRSLLINHETNKGVGAVIVSCRLDSLEVMSVNV